MTADRSPAFAALPLRRGKGSGSYPILAVGLDGVSGWGVSGFRVSWPKIWIF
jgi:hypothetical protein